MSQIFRIISPALLLLLMLQPSSVLAANQALMELLKALQENGTIDNKTYLLVKAVAEQEDEATSDLVSTPLNEDVEKLVEAKIIDNNIKKGDITINTKGKFEVASNDGDFKFRVGGRIQMDAATYAEDKLRHNDGTELRRVRLFAEGTLWENWNYKLQYDFTGSGINGL
ncbi:MAG: phosphate-selective porin OprO/OprP, partial [Gammaproteobacteria bacterium]